MASINVTDNTMTVQLKKWLGLNESPDGDAGIKMGEAAAMRNFRITREGNLQIRPGYAAVTTLSAGNPVRGMWSGYVGGVFHVLAACGGKVWDINKDTWTASVIGTIEDAPTHFFGFSKKVYILNGSGYYCWNGKSVVTRVEGYVPTVVTAASPGGGGTPLERVNLLTGKRKAQYSPDGESTVFYLPEAGIDSVDSVIGTNISWTVNTTEGTVTFSSAPEKGVNTITIAWTKGSGTQSKIAPMRFSETFNGSTDARVFLYGDGTNETVYSDLDENGNPTAEYFPDMNVIAVDSANTPLTALIRHYDRLLAFKSDGAFSINYSAMTLYSAESGSMSVEDTVTAAFYCTPLNREIGNEAVGQVRLIDNDPRTLFGGAAYRWALSSYGSRDERNAKRISDRVESTLGRFGLSNCVTFDDETVQEYYIVCGDEAVVNNYGTDTWYYYDHFPAVCMERVDGELYFGTPDGRIMHCSRQYHSDDTHEIDAYWESGSMDFGMDWRRKYSANIWVSVEPESQSRINVTAQSNRKSDYAQKTVAHSLATFANADFNHWSFRTNRKPQVERVRLKVKKFTFYKLIFSSVSATSTATILGVDFQVRHTGNVK